MSENIETSERTSRNLASDWVEYCKRGGGSNQVLVSQYKRKFGKVFATARKNGMSEPDQLPHPNHIDYDVAKRCFVVTGPTNVDEKFIWENLKLQIRMNEAIIKRMIAGLKKKPEDQDKLERLRVAEFVISCVEKKTPRGWNCHERLGWEKSKDQKARIW